MKTYQQLSLEELKEIKTKVEDYLYYIQNKEWFDEVYEYYGKDATTIKFEFCEEYDDQGGTDERISSVVVYDSNGKFLEFDNPDIVGDSKYSREDYMSDYYHDWKQELQFDSNILKINLKMVGILPEIYKLIEL